MKILSTIGLSALIFGFAKAQEGCFTSTLALLAAQAFDPKGDDERKVYTICDNAVIKIGIPDITQTDPFSNFVEGDFPLAVLRPNVSLQCSGCVINGGYVQLATLPSYTIPGAATFDKGTDNMLVKGFTFTGDLDSFVTPTIAFSAQNILIAGAGNNIVIEDCYFKDINIEGRLVVVGPTLGTGGAAATPPGTIDVTFRNLEFTNVTSSCMCNWRLYLAIRTQARPRSTRARTTCSSRASLLQVTWILLLLQLLPSRLRIFSSLALVTIL
jgi:hypothetical protein